MNNQHEPAISVLIPIYNVERYLPRCLDSVLAQTFSDFEVICVNDKSPDNSLDILKEYAQKDVRIRIIDKPRNEGSMMARHTGYTNAKGRYLFFLDGDDSLPANAFETLYRKSVESDADIVVGEMVLVNSAGGMMPKHRPERVGEDYRSYLKSILNWNIPSLCGSLFNRKLFDGYDYSALDHFRLSEDRILLTEILVQRKPTIATIADVTYYYWQNGESITHAASSEKIVTEQFRGLYRCYDIVESSNMGLTDDNNGFIIRYLSIYIEKGCDPAMIKRIDKRNVELLRYRVMSQYVGGRLATHTWLCCNMPPYRRAMHGIRLLIRKIQGKD